MRRMFSMNIKVLYFSKSGNTKKVAESIAKATNQVAESVPPAYPSDNVKLLFLGAGVYLGKIDDKMKNYIRSLDAKKVKNVALFSTSGSDKNIEINIMKELLVAKGINVLDKSFSCGGKFFIFFKRNHPNAEDLKNAQDFAIKIVEGIKE